MTRAAGGDDCDDPEINPDVPEVWYDGVDQDCDGGSDFDQDGDGFDAETETPGGTDCDDTDEIFPGADGSSMASTMTAMASPRWTTATVMGSPIGTVGSVRTPWTRTRMQMA